MGVNIWRAFSFFSDVTLEDWCWDLGNGPAGFLG